MLARHVEQGRAARRTGAASATSVSKICMSRHAASAASACSGVMVVGSAIVALETREGPPVGVPSKFPALSCHDFCNRLRGKLSVFAPGVPRPYTAISRKPNCAFRRFVLQARSRLRYRQAGGAWPVQYIRCAQNEKRAATIARYGRETIIISGIGLPGGVAQSTHRSKGRPRFH